MWMISVLAHAAVGSIKDEGLIGYGLKNWNKVMCQTGDATWWEQCAVDMSQYVVIHRVWDRVKKWDSLKYKPMYSTNTKFFK